MGNYFDFHLGKIIVEKWEKCSKTQYIQPKPLFSKKKKKKNPACLGMRGGKEVRFPPVRLIKAQPTKSREYSVKDIQ